MILTTPLDQSIQLTQSKPGRTPHKNLFQNSFLNQAIDRPQRHPELYCSYGLLNQAVAD